MPRKLALHCLTALLFTSFAGETLAHALWRPDGIIPPRNNRDDLKVGPCGNVPRTENPTYLQSGSTIVVEMESVIFHDGYYKISFSPANDQDFELNVLADNIPDIEGQQYFQQTITLPDIECDDCTLQLIQVMLDRNPPTNYYSCADIVLTETGLPEPDNNDTTPPSDIEFINNEANASSAIIEWRNPPEADFFQVLITRATSQNTAAPQGGTEYVVGDSLGNSEVVFNGTGTSFTDNSLALNSSYYYRAYAYDNSLNYANGSEIQINTGSANSAPAVSLSAEQNFSVTTTIQPGDGPVVIQASVNDADTGDNHSYDWDATDSALLDTDSAESVFTFNPASLSPGSYIARVSVNDNGNPPLSGSAQLTLTVAEEANPTTAPTPVPTATPTPDTSANPAPNDSETDNDEPSSSGGGAISPLSSLMLLLLLVLGRSVRRLTLR